MTEIEGLKKYFDDLNMPVIVYVSVMCTYFMLKIKYFKSLNKFSYRKRLKNALVVSDSFGLV